MLEGFVATYGPPFIKCLFSGCVDLTFVCSDVNGIESVEGTSTCIEVTTLLDMGDKARWVAIALEVVLSWWLSISAVTVFIQALNKAKMVGESPGTLKTWLRM